MTKQQTSAVDPASKLKLSIMTYARGWRRNKKLSLNSILMFLERGRYLTAV